MKIKPVDYKVLIKPEKVDDKSEGGLYIPETVREREEFSVDRGKIVDFGDAFFEKLLGPVPQIGDKVIFNRYAGSLITIKNDDGSRENYRLCNDKDICAIIEE